MMKKLFFCLLAVTMFSCIETPNQFEKLPPGSWRGILKISDQFSSSSSSAVVEADAKLTDYFELPFNFDIVYDEDGKMQMVLKNAEDSDSYSNLRIGRDPATAKDTLEIMFDDFDSYLDGFYEDNYIEGYWKVPYRGSAYQIPFLARYGDDHRFELKNNDDHYDFGGNWRVEFSYDTEDAYPAIAEFKQDGNTLTGTFMTETGDYRYLQGNVNNEKLKLSVFDGAHAFLFTGKVSSDTIIGEFRSGSHYKTSWKAYRDQDFDLVDPYSMTNSTVDESIDFEFEALNGDPVKLSDEAFKGKVKLINIMGSWCPNCKDEINFLKEIQKSNPELAIISVAFEKYKDKEKAKNVLRRYKKKMDITWPLLYGGYANKSETTAILNFVDRIYAYPTLIIVDKNNEIAGIQTGFYGPATSKHEDFKAKFYNILENIEN